MLRWFSRLVVRVLPNKCAKSAESERAERRQKKNSHPKLVYSPARRRGNGWWGRGRGAPGHQVQFGRRALKRFESAASGSSNYAEPRPFRAGAGAGERPSVKTLIMDRAGRREVKRKDEDGGGGRRCRRRQGRRTEEKRQPAAERAAKRSVRSSPNINNTNSAFQRTHAHVCNCSPLTWERGATCTSSPFLRTNGRERGANCCLHSAAATASRSAAARWRRLLFFLHPPPSLPLSLDPSSQYKLRINIFVSLFYNFVTAIKASHHHLWDGDGDERQRLLALTDVQRPEQTCGCMRAHTNSHSDT